MTTHSESASFGSPVTIDTHRHHREALGHMRLRRQVRDLIQGYTEATFLGGGEALEALAAGLGLEACALYFCDIRIDERIVTLVIVPQQGARRDAIMPKLLELRRQARAVGHRALLVPQGTIERQPRLGNATLLGAVSTEVKVGATARMVVLEHLIENGDCSISELARLIDHKDPFGAILHLASVGALKIDLKRVIWPGTLVGLPAPRFPMN